MFARRDTKSLSTFNKTQQSQREIDWLLGRLDEIASLQKQKSIRHRLKNLKKTFECAKKKVNANYRKDHEWQSLHGVPPEKAKYDKFWEQLDRQSLLNQLNSDGKERLNFLTSIRNTCIFEKMLKSLQAELSDVSSEEKLTHSSYKAMLEYTLNQIHLNKLEVLPDENSDKNPESLNQYAFTPFPATTIYQSRQMREQQDFGLFSSYREQKLSSPPKEEEKKEKIRYPFG